MLLSPLVAAAFLSAVPPAHAQAAADALAAQCAIVVAVEDSFVEIDLPSQALARAERVLIHIPPGYDDTREQPYPLVLFLHGSGRHHRSLLESPETRQVLEGSRCVVAMPRGGPSWWVDSPVDRTSRYASFLDEVVAFVERALNAGGSPELRGLGGWSMGGYGSALYLARRPEMFSAWAGIMPLVDFPNPRYPREWNHSIPPVLGDASHWPALNPLTHAAAFQGKRVFFLTGDTAFDRRMNETFARRLEELAVPHQFKMNEGSHTFAVVEKAFPDVMAFLEEAPSK